MFSIRCLASMTLSLGLLPAASMAQSLPERLEPPRQFLIPALPMTQQPAVRRPLGADKLPAHLWALPAGVIPGAPTSMTSERLPADWKRPVLDVPLLASEVDPLRPATPRLLTAARAFGLAADPQGHHLLDRFPQSVAIAVKATDDPSQVAAHGLITLAVPLATPSSAAFLRLTIADPFEHLKAIRVSTPPADSDAPDAARELPARPQLAAPAK